MPQEEYPLWRKLTGIAGGRGERGYTGCWSSVNSHWSLVIGHWSLVTGGLPISMLYIPSFPGGENLEIQSTDLKADT
ncbi:MAG: hypothetical protein ACFBSC_16450 [Microcoleaceae cyanobacterium]